MNPVDKALWYIEANFASALALEDVAAAAGVSRFHLARAFASVMDRPVMAHVRARRLSEAAKALAAGAPDILDVALDAGYGSHEAFTRAFRDLFGATPEAVRARGDVESLTLVEAVRMSQPPLAAPAPMRIAHAPVMLVAGFAQHFTRETTAAIPNLWQKLAPHLGHVPGQRGGASFGVCYNTDDDANMDYMAGVEVAGFSALPETFARIRIPAMRYAVFTHDDHVAAIQRTWAHVWSVGIPASGQTIADAPFFERYGPAFNPMTGRGDIEIWVPIGA
jgi:AraC family transcriptional regulator